MKAVLLTVFLLSSAGFLFGQTSFCITVQDPCCDALKTSGSYQLSENDNFQYYYIDYDSGDECNQVEIVCKADGFQIWSKTLVGCGRTSEWHPTANAHLITIEVTCSGYPGGSCQGCETLTSLVKVYTPSSHGCRFDCIIP